MRKINFLNGFWTVMAAVLLAFSTISCDGIGGKGKNWSKEVVHEFPNTNWAFEEEVLDFPFDIEDTSLRYDITVTLRYDTTVAVLKDIPLSLTLRPASSCSTRRIIRTSKWWTRIPQNYRWWSIRIANSRPPAPTPSPSTAAPKKPTITDSSALPQR